MRPTIGMIHIDGPLTNIAVDYQPQGMIGDIVSPYMKVENESDRYFVIDRKRMSGAYGSATPTGDRFLRAIGAQAKSLGGFTVSTAPYSVEQYSLNELIPDRLVENQDSPLNIRASSTEQVAEVLKMEREFRVQSLFTTASNYPTGSKETAPVVKWDAAAADIYTPIKNAKLAIRKNTLGREATHVIISDSVFESIRTNNTDLRDRIKYVAATTISDLTPQLLARYWEIPNVIIARSYFNSAGEGATENLVEMWGDSVIVCRIEPPSLRYLGFSQSFTTKTGGMQTKTWRDETREGEITEVSMYSDEVLINPTSGYLIPDVLP